MPIPVQQFQILSAQQANPFFNGLSSGADLYRQFLINKNLPEQLQQQSQARELANSIAKIKAQFAPQTAQADLDQEREQTQKLQLARLNPLLGATGVAGQIGSALWLQQHPELNNAQQTPGNNGQQNLGNVGLGSGGEGNPINDQQQNPMPAINSLNNPNGFYAKPGSLADSIMSNLQTSEQTKNSLSRFYDTRSNAYGWQQLPVDSKSQLLARAQGLGYSPLEASKQFSQGNSIEQLAQAKGFNPNNPDSWPDPQYAPTSSTRSTSQQREQAGAELDVLQDSITKSLAPYSRKINGYSPQQVFEAIKGENPEGQSNFLSAYMLGPELASIRMRSLGGRVGIGAIREMQDKSLTDLKVFEPFISQEVYEKTMNKVKDKINQALGAAQKVANSPGKSYKNNKEDSDNNVISFKGTKYRRTGPNQWEPME